MAFAKLSVVLIALAIVAGAAIGYSFRHTPLTTDQVVTQKAAPKKSVPECDELDEMVHIVGLKIAALGTPDKLPDASSFSPALQSDAAFMARFELTQIDLRKKLAENLRLRAVVGAEFEKLKVRAQTCRK
jgi:hypothetical protein